LLFEVEQGDDLADLITASRLEGPIGDASRETLEENCPVLTRYERAFWRAYGDLATMRGVSMTALPIPLDKIVWYAEYNGYTSTQTAILIRVIRNMDSAYLNAIRPRAGDTK
jgi:hypothetical protein